MTKRVYHPEARCNLVFAPREGYRPGREIELTAVQPISVQATSNPVNKADTFEVTFEETLFPIDPRQVRSMSVDIHMGDSGSLDQDLDVATNAHRMFFGVVDELQSAFPEDDTTTVTFTGRDYSAFLLDKEWGQRTVQLGRPLDMIVRDVLSTFDAEQQLDVRVEGFNGPAPTVSAVTQKERQYAAKGEDSVKKGLDQLAKRAGALITVQYDEVVVRPPRNTNTTSIKPLFVAGRNLSNLEVTRQLGANDLPNVLVQAVDPNTREVVEGQFPRPFKGDVEISKSGQGGQTSRTKSTKVKKFQVQLSSPTRSQLDTIAERIFRRFEQQQLEVHFETKDMRTWEVVGTQTTRPAPSYEVASLKNGDAIRILIDRDTRSILDRAVSKQHKARQLQSKGYSPKVAEQLAESWKGLNHPLWVSEARHNLDADGGYTLEVDAQNAITVEDDV
ncbi:MAG: hypothetical protein ABEN55_09485 [Bradymonadaceae bacterium]